MTTKIYFLKWFAWKHQGCRALVAIVAGVGHPRKGLGPVGSVALVPTPDSIRIAAVGDVGHEADSKVHLGHFARPQSLSLIFPHSHCFLFVVVGIVWEHLFDQASNQRGV